MALQLILGGSGSGKSYRMYKNLIEASMANPQQQFIIIVPEQYTMQTQKNIVSMHPRHGVMNIDIVSFGRLAYRIFEETGKMDTHILEDTGKRMVIRKVLEQKKKELSVFTGSIRKQGFTGELKSMISELLQYNITPPQLLTCIEKTGSSSVLHGKLKDLEVIYRGFNDYIEGHFLTAEEILNRLCPVIAQSSIIKNSLIYLDNFTGFTPSQYHLLAELLMHSQGVQMTLTVDIFAHPYELKNNYELFYLTKETIYRLEKLCKEIHCERQKDIWLNMDGEVRFEGRQDLIHLEKSIYRKKAAVFQQTPENIRLYNARNPGNEAEFVARAIRRLVRDEHIRYREIAVITGDVNGYRHMIERSFNALEIPCFIDLKRSVLNNAFVESLRALIQIFADNFSYESVFRYLRSGFAGMGDPDIDLLENYVLAFGIRGASGWQNKWMKRHRKISDTMLLALNQQREAVFEAIWPIYEIFKDKSSDVRMRNQALIQWIYAMNMKSGLEACKDRFDREGRLSMAREYDQVYDVIMDLLEKMSDILGDEIVSSREYADILDAGFNELKLGLIPPGIDEVMVGDIQRTRLNGIKVLFFMGANEGIVPSPVKDGGLINDKEKNMLATLNVELSPTSRQMGYFEQFYIYAALTKASRRVILSYSQVGASGKALRPSSLIRKLVKIFPQLTAMECEQEEGWMSWMDNEPTAFKRLIQGLNHMDKEPVSDVWKEAYGWFLSSDRYKEQTKKLLDAAFVSYITQPLSRAAIKALYGTELENSVTTLENYAACAYSHFLSFGLELSEREVNEIKSPDLGIVFHKALELFSTALKTQGYSWQDVPENVREELSVQCANEAAQSFKHTALLETKRNQYQITRLIRYILRTTWAIKKQLQKGDFSPEAFEIRFDSDELSGMMDVALSKNVLMKLKGTIDRIDLCEDDQNIYVKIVDYKSGNQKFDIAALYYGLSLQLVVYMNAAQALESKKHQDKKIIPAGILYYNIDDPMIDGSDIGTLGDDSQRLMAAEEEILASLKSGGLVNSDPDIIRLLDKEFTKESTVIPVAYTASGELSKRSGAVSTRQFLELGQFVAKKVEVFGEEILAGNINIDPYVRSGRGACTYCAFRSVCGFDEGISGYKYRRLGKLTAEDVWKEIGREVNTHGDEMD